MQLRRLHYVFISKMLNQLFKVAVVNVPSGINGQRRSFWIPNVTWPAGFTCVASTSCKGPISTLIVDLAIRSSAKIRLIIIKGCLNLSVKLNNVSFLTRYFCAGVGPFTRYR